MSTQYPTTSIDSYTTLVDNSDDVLAAHMNDRGDAIIALETKLGIDDSLVATTVDYFLKNASGRFRTHVHDGGSDDGAQLDWDACWADAVHDHSSSAEGGAIPLSSVTDYPFKTGDWILSSVTTARTGWTNVTSSYSNKFIRIGTTALTTGGSDTHTHGGATGSHTLTIAEIPAHTHSTGTAVAATNGGPNTHALADSSAVTGSTGGGGSHNHTLTTADNVPAYVKINVFQKS